MRTEILKVVSMNKYFKVVQSSGDIVKYTLEKPTKILMQNIHFIWLKYLYSKTSKNLPVFVDEKHVHKKKNNILPYGFLKQHITNYSENTIIDHNILNYCPNEQSILNFNIIVAQQDVMQYFIQWQRYRKFWWSSITTTPSLFAINDIKYEDNSANVDIIAQFPWGKQLVETVTVNPSDMGTSCLSCTMSLEGALFTLLMDGQTMQNKEEYLRLHRKMAPYKISFALDCAASNHKQSLCELAKLLDLRLKRKRISSWLPNLFLPFDEQIKENLQIGVTYTAILDETTLENGIFHLMNSSTMLKEQVHVADFDAYAALLCGK